MSVRNRLLSSTFIPLVVGFGVGLTVVPCSPRAASNTYQLAQAKSPLWWDLAWA